MLKPEQRCEAIIDTQTTRESVSRYVFDFEGRRHDLGTSVIDQTGIAETTIDCSRCEIAGIVFQTEGNGPYGAYNEATRKTKDFLRDNCMKFIELQERTGIRDVPRDLHPKL